MFPIYQNTGDQGHDFSSFKETMVQICNEHKEAGRALAFAFILYDFENAHLRKILSDSDYWLALNHISSNYLTVFSINYSSQIMPKRRHDRMFHMLIDVQSHYNPSMATNVLVQRYFNQNKVNYPAVLFFQVDNENVTDSLLVELKEEKIESGFLEVKNYISRAVKALERISNNNRQNSREIFDCLENEVKTYKTVLKFKRMIRNAGNLVGLISSVKGLVS